MNSKRLNGKVAIITGAAQGQGNATALRFAQEGARVTCFDIQALDRIQETVDDIKKLGSDGIAIRGDVSKASDIDACINSTIEKFWRIDVLVNCAGIMILKPFLEQTAEDWPRRRSHGSKYIGNRGPHVVNRIIQRVNQFRDRGYRFPAHAFQRDRRQNPHARTGI